MKWGQSQNFLLYYVYVYIYMLYYMYIYIYVFLIYTYSIYAAYNMAFCLELVNNRLSCWGPQYHIVEFSWTSTPTRSSPPHLFHDPETLLSCPKFHRVTISAAMAPRNASMAIVFSWLSRAPHLAENRLSSASLDLALFFLSQWYPSLDISTLTFEISGTHISGRFFLGESLPTNLHESPSIHGPAKLFTGQKASQLLVKSLAHAPFYLTPTSFVERAF